MLKGTLYTVVCVTKNAGWIENRFRYSHVEQELWYVRGLSNAKLIAKQIFDDNLSTTERRSVEIDSYTPKDMEYSWTVRLGEDLYEDHEIYIKKCKY